MLQSMHVFVDLSRKMLFKITFVAFLAVGVLAEYKLTDEQQQLLREKLVEACKKNGAEDKVDDAEKAVIAFPTCVQGLFNPDTIKAEVEEAKPHGTLDEVFKKYCAKAPELKNCITAAKDGVLPCLDPSYTNATQVLARTVDSFLDFLCHKDGDRIAMFISEGGPECFQEKMNPIRECATKLRDALPTPEAVKALTPAERCGKFEELSTCVVTALEGCSSPTPANMIDSLFKYGRKQSPCAKKDD